MTYTVNLGDVVPPVVTGTADRAPNARDWYAGPVTITWTATDPAPSSGPPTVPAPTVLSSDGANQTATSDPSCDPAGNCATGSYGPVSIDSIAPIITYTVAPAANVNNWHRAALTVTFTCSDTLSGVASCSSPVTLSAEGAEQSVTGTAVDNAGNVTTVTADDLNIDKTVPTITGTAGGTPNAAGWRKNPSIIRFTCDDALSGVHSCTPTTTLNEGANQSITGTVVDFAGNTASTTLSGINIALTSPTITAVVTPAPNVNGWRHTAVTVTFTCADALSGIATCPAPITVSTDGLNQSVNGKAIDVAGNSTTLTVDQINIDKVLPTITGTASGTPNAAGWRNAASTVTFTCGDALSGVHTCTGPTTLGEGANQSVTGSAVDFAGNTRTATVSGINIDLTRPTVGTFTVGSKTSAQTETFTAPAADALSGAVGGEYFTGTDPGPGNGTPMTYSAGNLTGTLGTDLPVGVYPIYVRSRDAAGNWSTLQNAQLTVTVTDAGPAAVRAPHGEAVR